MANLWKILKRVNSSRKHNKRFYSSRDMAEIKHREANKNSQINRGEMTKASENHLIYECGCGVEGCFIHCTYTPQLK